MKIFGLDFTSAPTPRKPITCAICELYLAAIPDKKPILILHHCLTIPTFADFEDFLKTDGPWLAAFDFPFGQPRQLITNLGWPTAWGDYMQLIASMNKATFEETLAHYRARRLPGDKQHLRATDTYAHARSPMMLHRVPVGKMFFQGTTRLLAASVSILPCRPTLSDKIVVEGYPALVARKWLGNRSYKSDERARQTVDQAEARWNLLTGLCSPALFTQYGFALSIAGDMFNSMIEEPMGDLLDSLLCAIQAAWAYTQRDNNYGIPLQCDSDEGWIVDPAMMRVG